jgi:hypothetical protein
MNRLAPTLRPGDTVLVGLSWNDVTTPQTVDAPQIAIVEGHLVKVEGDMEAKAARVRLYDATGIPVPLLQNLKSFFDVTSDISALVYNLYPRAKAIYYRWRDRSPMTDRFDAGVPDANFTLLARMRDQAEQSGARFVVVLLPNKIFFEDKAYAVYSVNGRDFPQQNTMGYISMPLCAKFGLICLDSFALLHAHQLDPVAYVVDGHYNPTGARLIGEWLAASVGR